MEQISLDFMAHEIVLEVGNVPTTDLNLMGKESLEVFLTKVGIVGNFEWMAF